MTGNGCPTITSIFSSIFYNNHGQSGEPNQKGKQDVER